MQQQRTRKRHAWGMLGSVSLLTLSLMALSLAFFFFFVSGRRRRALVAERVDRHDCIGGHHHSGGVRELQQAVSSAGKRAHERGCSAHVYIRGWVVRPVRSEPWSVRLWRRGFRRERGFTLPGA